VSEHLRNIYESGELVEGPTLRKIRTVRTEGKREVAREVRRLAEEQYDEFRVRQDREFESDFEAEVERIESMRPRKRKS
jgi:hypothetical protein